MMEVTNDEHSESIVDTLNSPPKVSQTDELPTQENAVAYSKTPSIFSTIPGMSNTVKQYTCRVCQLVFPSKSACSLHSKQHVNHSKKHRCDVCGKTFLTSFYLKQHMRIHSGLKPYRCPICEQAFKQLAHVQQHVRTHTGALPYNCTFPGCGKAFEQLSQLNSHELKHLSEDNDDNNQMYECDWPNCDKSFTSVARLNLHLSRHQSPQAPRRRRKRKRGRPRKKPLPDESDEDLYITADDLIHYDQGRVILEVIDDGVPSVKPYLCPGCSKLCVRLDLFKKHLIACRNRLKASVREAADALGIEPTNIVLPVTDAPE